MPEVILPCPACGDDEFLIVVPGLPSEEFRVHCGCGHTGRYCKTEEEAIRTHNALPRAPRWTHEPPKVAGFYWHIGSDMSIYSDISGIMTVYAQNGELGYLKNGEFCTKFEADDQWAGPIPPPID